MYVHYGYVGVVFMIVSAKLRFFSLTDVYNRDYFTDNRTFAYISMYGFYLILQPEEC